ncbi:At5g01610-like protein [Dioscorea alata]|uniref:At5g01610-like protein n=1 Tax=Dioscorea alata TaxID=55571 RepID=A0ACB7V0R0_DIOAL|nr:At5g01610-like protein [Dioscorea alata]
MSQASLLLLLLCFGFTNGGFPARLTSPDLSKPTAYEILQSYGFPIGLLPLGVSSYDLDAASGEFSAYLNGSCSLSVRDSYELWYEPTISGTVSQNHLSNLRGISVKVLFLWLNIVDIRRSGDDLEFSVGITSANFPIDNFSVCPQCGGQAVAEAWM